MMMALPPAGVLPNQYALDQNAELLLSFSEAIQLKRPLWDVKICVQAQEYMPSFCHIDYKYRVGRARVPGKLELNSE